MKRIEGVIAGLLCLAAVNADLSRAEKTGFGPGRSLDPKGALIEAGESRAPEAPAPVALGYVEGGEPAVGVEWKAIPGGKFTMGTTDGDYRFSNANAIHEVVIEGFEMSKTEVTVEQYNECVVKGACKKRPDTGLYCNWGKEGRERYPVNCVDWDQADQYAKFKGARLPSEAEWEYAATSAGRNHKYPWGNEEPTSGKAVYDSGSARPVCSKPAGNTAQGLCDMAGNVWEWTQDWWHDSYKGAPADGSAWEDAGSDRVVRGGSFFNYEACYLRADFRNTIVPGYRFVGVGFRLARSSR